jgi:voltage-dependent calcium channel T type alpha-1G
MIMKMVAFGLLFNGDQSYFRISENNLDCLVVTFSLVSIFLPIDLSSFRVLRLLRVLRPIRIISRNEGLKISISSLIMALPQIVNVVLINMLFFVTFSIIGVNMFKGLYYTCVSEAIFPAINVDSKWMCYNAGGSWERMAHNFD